MLERHERDPERCSGYPELFDQTELGNPLARLEGPVEQELAEPERRLRRLRVRVVAARHDQQRNRPQPLGCSPQARLAAARRASSSTSSTKAAISRNTGSGASR